MYRKGGKKKKGVFNCSNQLMVIKNPVFTFFEEGQAGNLF
jgi:hypothetical protein